MKMIGQVKYKIHVMMQILAMKSTAGMGVSRFTDTQLRTLGMCPSRPPTKKSLQNHTTQFNQINFINTKRKRKFVALFQCSLNDSSLNIILYLAEVKRIPFTPPKVESETNTGMIHHIIPYSLLENIYNMQFKTITTIN